MSENPTVTFDNTLPAAYAAPLDVRDIEAEHAVTPPGVLLSGRVTMDDPLSDATHPYRPSVSLSVAVLCVEVLSGRPCNTIYAREADGRKDADVCPVCGSAAAFEISRVIR